MDFGNIMKNVYNELKLRYEQTVSQILQDTDIDGIDFPVVPNNLEVIQLKDCLSPELVAKLNLQSETEGDGVQAKVEEEKKSGDQINSLERQFDGMGVSEVSTMQGS